MRLGSFVTGAVISVFVTALIVLTLSRDEELLAIDSFESIEPFFTFLVVGVVLATEEDHQSKAQRGLYQNHDTDDGDPDHTPTHQDSDLNQPTTPGQTEGVKSSRKTRLLGYLKKLDGIEAQLSELKNGEGDGWSKKTNSG